MNARESEDAQRRNRSAWNRMVRQGQRFTRPAKQDDLHAPLKTVDSIGWLGDSIVGKHVLCLAAGGGKHSIIYAAAGAVVTVVDISDEMLQLDQLVARERGLDVRTVEASMDSLDELGDESFDIVIQPVSTCYLPNLMDVYHEVARVTRPGGLYISQHKQPISLQSSLRTNPQGAYEIRETYYREKRIPDPEIASALREEGTWEYLHRWETLVGGLCRAGFVIEDLVEPLHAKQDAARDDFGHRANYIAPYVRIKARRHDDRKKSSTRAPLILPP